MAVFKIDVEKQLGSEYWSNVYYVEANGIAEAATFAVPIAQAERSFTSNTVLFTKARTSDLVPNTDNYITSVLNAYGQNAGQPSELLPLFNVIRVDLVTGRGRPGRKYYRACLFEPYVSGSPWTLSAGIVDAVNNAINGLLATVPLVQKDGDQIVTAEVYTTVSMRQLRRGSKRKQKPVLPS